MFWRRVFRVSRTVQLRHVSSERDSSKRMDYNDERLYKSKETRTKREYFQQRELHGEAPYLTKVQLAQRERHTTRENKHRTAKISTRLCLDIQDRQREKNRML